MNYGEIISEAFRLTWRNRFLWFFGFFVGGGGGFSSIPNSVSNFRGPSKTGPSGHQIGRFISENVGLIVALAVLLVALVLVWIFLSLVSQAALADGVAALHRGEERRFSSTFRAGLSNFWRVLGFAVLFFIISIAIAFLIFALAALPIIGVLAATNSIGVRIGVIALVALIGVGLLIVIFVLLSIFGRLGLRTLVVGREGIFSSLRSGYSLFLRHPGQGLLVWLVGVALSLGVTLALLILALILGLVLAAPVVALFIADLRIVAIVVGVMATIVFLVPFVIAWAAIGTFNHAYWTLAYLRLVTLTEEAIRGPDQGA